MSLDVTESGVEPAFSEKQDTPVKLPWKVLGRALGFPNHDHELWWLNCAPLLNAMLRQCNYDIHLQYQYMSCFYLHVIPVLGPFFAPGTTPRFFSKLNKDGYPIDFSMNFQKTGATVRMSFAVLTEFSGLPQDPLAQFGTREFLGKLALIDPNIDLRWMNHFESEFAIRNGDAQHLAEKLAPYQWQTKGVALDLKKDGTITPKVYYLSLPPSKLTGIPGSTMFFSAIDRLGAEVPGLFLIREYFKPLVKAKAAEAVLLGLDCVSMAKSPRIKVSSPTTGLHAKTSAPSGLSGAL
ncbi:hypothetical protein FE257_011888 [Aspergillus nanangensis]|uniref:Uncharacterized protein n=1 Tax=Aspergillus nanangensis TaxID=2582783 RepID=A0AAD4CGZ6_ASPNN|nr:hypothetical protein FE257_011888 [Aspergillus nanangensis]